MGSSVGAGLKRGVLAAMTLGTSEIKTGGGTYKDETVADTLFPKAVNDWALEDRQQARNATDQAAADQKAAIKPPPLRPDLTDTALQTARRQESLRLLTGQGRRGTFLTGPTGVTAAPSLGRTVLGGQ